MRVLRRRIVFWLGALAGAIALAPSTVAQGDAPRVDPKSPAGTEYQLPIDRAREQARGRGSGDLSSATGRAPLFGAGVGRATAAPARQSSSSGAGTRRTEAKEQPDPGTSVPTAILAQEADGGGNGSELVAIGAGGAGVLLIGGLAGLGWRRSMRR